MNDKQGGGEMGQVIQIDEARIKGDLPRGRDLQRRSRHDAWMKCPEKNPTRHLPRDWRMNQN